MAKLGNETKLVLNLAKERMGKLRDSRALSPNPQYVAGYNRAHSDWLQTLDRVVSERQEG